MKRRTPRKKKLTPAQADVGLMLKSLRTKAGLSMRALAEKAKLSYESVRLLEQGRGGVKALSAVMEALSMKEQQRRRMLLSFLGV